MNQIGVLNEQSLHAKLKAWYAGEQGLIEAMVDGYIIDVVRGECLIEIQTSNFSKIKSKLANLAKNHSVKLVYPIAREKWLLKLPRDEKTGQVRRKSPKSGDVYEIFDELVSFPELILEPRFSIELALIHVEEVRRYSGNKLWRRSGWEIVDRRLIRVDETFLLQDAKSFSQLLPKNLTEGFTTRDLADSTGISFRSAQKVVYCLRKMDVLKICGKRGRYNCYVRSQ